MNRLPVIETERLRLRPLQMEDGPHVFAIFSDEHVLRHYGMEPHRTLEETEQMLTHMLAQIETGAIIRFAIEHRESKALIGTIGHRRIGVPRSVMNSNRSIGVRVMRPKPFTRRFSLP